MKRISGSLTVVAVISSLAFGACAGSGTPGASDIRSGLDQAQAGAVKFKTGLQAFRAGDHTVISQMRAAMDTISAGVTKMRSGMAATTGSGMMGMMGSGTTADQATQCSKMMQDGMGMMESGMSAMHDGTAMMGDADPANDDDGASKAEGGMGMMDQGMSGMQGAMGDMPADATPDAMMMECNCAGMM